MDDQTKTWLIVGGVAVLLFLFLRAQGGSSTTGPGLDPQAVQLETARMQAASTGFSSLTGAVTSLEQSREQNQTAIELGRLQAGIENTRTNAQLAAIQAQIQGQRDAVQAQADAQTKHDVLSTIGSVATSIFTLGGIL